MKRDRIEKIGGVKAAYKKPKNRTSIKVGFTIMTIALVVICVLFLPVWMVSTITTEGNKKVSSKTIEEASTIKLGTHILRINPKEVEANLKHVPYIEDVKVSLSFPNRVIISVKETEVASYVKFAGGYIGIDNSGRVIETVSKSDSNKVPIITGVKVTTFNLGEKISIDETEKFDIILLCINEIKKSGLLSDITQIDCEDINDIRITAFSGLYIQFGDKEQISYKVAMLVKVIEKLGKDAAGSIDLKDPTKAVYKVN